MRSILVHFRSASEEEVIAFLKRTYPFQPGPPWILDKAGDAAVYIDIYEDLNTEFEVEAYFALLECLGGEPSVSVQADVSGRHKGDEEARLVACTLLDAFDGIVQDEYTDHCWTAEQIRNNHMAQGHSFFDYEGWYIAEQPQGEDKPSA